MNEQRDGRRPVVVVTGASGGIGRATARMFGARGAAVALLARGEKGLAGAADDVEAAGGQPLPIPVDVADHKQVEIAAERIEVELGPIDTWVNVAFTSVFAPFTEISPEEFKLGRRQHGGHPDRQQVRRRPAGPLPRADRVQLPADRAAARSGRPRQPVGAGRRARREGLRRARPVRRSLGRAQHQLWASQHHGLLGAARAVAVAAGFGLLRRR